MTQQQPSQTALITGGSAGLGFTLAGFLAAQGYTLIINGRDRDRLQAAAARLEEHGGTITAVPGDVGDRDQRRKLIDAVGEIGRLDLLINNASTLGPLPMPELTDYPPDDLRRVFEINTFAPLMLVQALRPYLAAAGGLVVNLSSDAAGGGYENWGGYGASKAALDLISLTLANELRPEGIGVVSVDPGDGRRR